MKSRSILIALVVMVFIVFTVVYFAHPKPQQFYTPKEKVNDVITIIQELDKKPSK